MSEAPNSANESGRFMDVFHMDLKFLVVLFTCIGESGEVTVSSYPKPPFPKREIIKFKQPFMDRPAVMYGIKMIDSAYNKNTRADVKLLWVRPEAFSILMKSAYDSHLYGLGVSWMACL
uniref:H-type lectin domain-containing protein n=3 Tax=Magallana gigas TaxID=29159 RepID=K1Q1N3_MAGGI